MHKFFVQNEFFNDNTVVIQGEDVKHIYKVLRLSIGDRVIINNCKGKEFEALIQDINKKEVVLTLEKEVDINNESNINIHLFQGLPKASKMDLIVQKSAELGIKSIIPVITQRVVVKSELGEFKKTDRWKRIALEACKQCKRTFIPEVEEPIDFSKLKIELGKMDLILVPYENALDIGVKKVMQGVNKEGIRDIAVVIGPEGGFEKEEIEELTNLGAHIVTLGPRILRTETAGFVCSTLIQYELGDLGGII